MQFYLVFALLFSLVVAVFAIQNTEVVIIKFLTFQFPVSLVLVIIGSAVVGALALYFISLFKQVGFWFKLRQTTSRKGELEKQVKKLEKKVAELEVEKSKLESSKLSSDNTNESQEVEELEKINKTENQESQELDKETNNNFAI